MPAGSASSIAGGSFAGGPLAEDADGIKPPSALLLLLEGRALWEFGASIAASPFMNQVPRGDGHPVLVFPGLSANDVSTIPMRNFLRDRGYAPHPWNYGFNFGPRPGVLRGCVEHVRELHEKYGRKVSLIGWSLGGLYAREVAKQVPELTRCVITLGTPFTGNPKATHAWRLYEWVSDGKVDEKPEVLAQLRVPPPVPTTSIYSKTDGIVAWQCSLNPLGAQTENIEIHASHFGMGLNPAALYAIADRLAQPEGAWRPFERSGARKWFYKAA
jgi:pimeloyl-ACP methyl ester carboxylesterase